jgi:tetratricopeptide (TPR) repeat protein
MDSAKIYFDKSIRLVPDVARFYYNFGRAYTETGDPQKAKGYYEKAVALDSTYVVALHNLGILLFAELKQPLEARTYLLRLTAIDSTLPIVHYMLGEIALGEENNDAASSYFNCEIALFSNNRYSAQLDSLPRSRAGELYAAYMSHLRLAQLWAKVYKDPKKAREHYQKYLEMEPDERERSRIYKEMNKYLAGK